MNAPTSFGLAFFLRVALPGFFTVLIAAPLLPADVAINLTATGLGTIAGLSGVAGLLLFLLDTVFYLVFEGRILWPVSLREWKTARWEDWLDARWEQIPQVANSWQQLDRELVCHEEARKKRNIVGELISRDETRKRLRRWSLELKLGLLYYDVMAFPFFRKDERSHALWPTRLGNVMASYEYYPEECYGMDAAFYWYRLWLLLPADTRRDYENIWAVGQAWLYMAAVSVASLITYGGLTLWSVAANIFHLSSPAPHRIATFVEKWWNHNWGVATVLMSIAILSWGAWLVAYWAAREQHRQSGEFFKSLFDLYREDLIVQPFQRRARGDWRDAADYLRFFKGGSILGRRDRSTKASS